MPVRDLLIVGAGPSGLATAIAAKQHGLDYAVVDKVFPIPRMQPPLPKQSAAE